MIWSQNYAPLGNNSVSALLAALPVATLLGLLAFWHVRAHLSALAGLLVAGAIAVLVYHMPATLALMSAVYGAAFGLFPIGWIVLNAIFVYDLSVETGQFAVLQRQVAGLSGDRRIQALLVAFSFGAFVEGAAGFGAPVAITGALMIGLGFRPLEAAKLALIGNTAPVAFGALGTPLLTLAKVTGLDLQALSSMVGRQLGLVSIIVPFWLVAAQSGWRGMLGVWPACLVTGLTFGTTQFLVSNFHGPWLVGIVSALVSMGSLVVLMNFWKPARRQTGEETAGPASEATGTPASLDSNAAMAVRTRMGTMNQTPEARCSPASPGEGRREEEAVFPQRWWKAWLPWVFLSVFVFLWGLPGVKHFLNALFAPNFAVLWLDNCVQRMPPVVATPMAEPATFAFNALSATGTALLLAGLLAGFCLGLGPVRLFGLYCRTVWRVRISLLTIALMLALGFTTRYSGTDTTLGLALASTGWFFPFFSPLIGWLGVALTGSDTSSNVLFGNLQQVTAQRLNLSPVLMASANSSGGVMGKMIDAQSIVVASVATGGHPQSPDAGTVLRSVFWHSLALAILIGFLVMLQAYL
ncbi:MAG TPA: L-lactate permease [Candidatus Acidoferrum sp.]|jgi:lactate permease|nr:L-lactate permease [Candidatus Acidoferrum sp.]